METFLARIPLFSTLPKEALHSLIQHCSEQRYPKGRFVFREGEGAESVWVVKEGWLQLVRHTSSDKPITLFIMTPDEVLCGLSAFDHSVYSADGIAVTEAVLIHVPASIFSKLMEDHPAFARETLTICCHRIKKMGQAYAMAYEPVKERIASVLVRLYEKFGRELPFTHREIAQMAGTTTESCIRTLSQMKKQGWVKGRRSCVELKNLKSIERLLNGLKSD